MSSVVKMQEETMRPNSERGGVVVLDFGGQYTQLIARRVREQQVFSAVLPCTASIADIRKYEPSGLILSGGPSSAYDADAPTCDHAVLAMGVPVLGICYGMHWITRTLGGKVEKAGTTGIWERVAECGERTVEWIRGVGFVRGNTEERADLE